jgi:galactose mutarotase-like enzyme
VAEQGSKPKRRKRSAGVTIGGIVAGIEQQIFKTTPPVDELVQKGAPLRPVAAAGGRTLRIAMPGDADVDHVDHAAPRRLQLQAHAVDATVDLAVGGRLASFRVDGMELLRTEGYGPIQWGSYPMAPYAGRVRRGSFGFDGRTYDLPITMAPHAIHGTVLDREWAVVGDGSIATQLGPDWPFKGRAIQRFELTDDHLTFELSVESEDRMPASLGWHPWFLRRPPGTDAPIELDFEAGSMYLRDDDGITTSLRIPPPPEPWDDCFTEVRRPPVLRWPGFLELTIESACRDWVVYTVPEDAVCVEPQTAPPDALNGEPAIVEPGTPLTASMTWRWRRLA